MEAVDELAEQGRDPRRRGDSLLQNGTYFAKQHAAETIQDLASDIAVLIARAERSRRLSSFLCTSNM